MTIRTASISYHLSSLSVNSVVVAEAAELSETPPTTASSSASEILTPRIIYINRDSLSNQPASTRTGSHISLSQFNVPGNSEKDDFDQVYAANVHSGSPPTLPSLRQATPPFGHVQPKHMTPLEISPAGDVTEATPPQSPGEKIVLMCGPKAINAQRYKRDYVVGGATPRHVTTNTFSLPR